jgi:DNA-3-methyladenine glycosylase I
MSRQSEQKETSTRNNLQTPSQQPTQQAVKPKTYCEFTRQLDRKDVNRVHHDQVHGFAVTDDNELFGRLLMEINQAGLSWTTILRKQENLRKAYGNYCVEHVATYGEQDRQRLLSDSGIIRNRLKIDAAIYNAGVILQLQQQYGSFKNWLDHHHPKALEDWVKVFKKTFRFTGKEIVNEFLMSTGYLPGAHTEDCPLFKKVIRSRPMWYQTGNKAKLSR